MKVTLPIIVGVWPMVILLWQTLIIIIVVVVVVVVTQPLQDKEETCTLGQTIW